jgi:serine/threonine-protein kinase HipA
MGVFIVFFLLPALDTSEQVFVDAYKAQLLARCERYLAMAAEIKSIEL